MNALIQQPYQGYSGHISRLSVPQENKKASSLIEGRLDWKFTAWLEDQDRKAELLPLWPQNLISLFGFVLLVCLAVV
jgi:poly(3-hydroxyalkanoate) synthetase